MNTLFSLAIAGHNSIAELPTAAWDVKSFLKNAGAFVKDAGGLLLILMGLAAIVWGGVLLLKKLMGGQQNQDSWVKIIMLLLVGGAIAAGGFTLIAKFGEGGKTTIEQLGNGTILWDTAAPLGMLFGLG